MLLWGYSINMSLNIYKDRGIENSLKNLFKWCNFSSDWIFLFDFLAKEQAGVRYITEDLIKKVSGHEHMSTIVSLNLCFSKKGGKKIKVS